MQEQKNVCLNLRDTWCKLIYFYLFCSRLIINVTKKLFSIIDSYVVKYLIFFMKNNYFACLDVPDYVRSKKTLK